MAKIVPTITVYEGEIDKYLENYSLLRIFSDRIHIDLADGTITPRKMIDINDISFGKDLEIDIHFMTNNPAKYLDKLIELKPNRVILHAEIDQDIKPTLKELKQHGIKTGIVIMPKIVPELKNDLIQMVDAVLIFAGELGRQGGTADLTQSAKARLIKQINPNVEILWDGGANINNAGRLANAGIEVINVGSAISKTENPETSYQALAKEAKKGIIHG